MVQANNRRRLYRGRCVLHNHKHLTIKNMEILVLGPGCRKCVTTYDAIKKVIDETGADATVRKIDDIMEIMKFNVMATPAIVVDGEVKIKGYVPSDTEIRKLLGV